MEPERDPSVLASASDEQPSTLRQELWIVCRALMFLVGAGIPMLFVLFGVLRDVLFREWQGLLFTAMVGLEAALFGLWTAERIESSRAAGLASGALGFGVGRVAFAVMSRQGSGSDGFEWMPGTIVLIALFHSVACVGLFLRARQSGWKVALGTFLTGAIALASIFYGLAAMLPEYRD